MSNIIATHFKIGPKIGEGSFGTIFQGQNLLTSQPVALKFEPRSTQTPQLRDEYRVYHILNHIEGIPNAYYFGQEGLHNVLVVDLLGPSLEDLFEWCGRKFSVGTTCLVGIEMLERIKDVHSMKLIYRDIKPDNFLIGRSKLSSPNSFIPNGNNNHSEIGSNTYNKNGPNIFLIDFGMAKQYINPNTQLHIPYKERKPLSGTARYMSRNTHKGIEQSRRDDLESLGHVLLYFLRGSLPWQGLKAATNKQKYEKIGKKKCEINVDILCEGLPKQFAEYLKYVRQLEFEQEPDYNYLQNLLRQAFIENKCTEGWFDWFALNGGRGWDLSINRKPNLHGYGNAELPRVERAKKDVGLRPVNDLGEISEGSVRRKWWWLCCC